MATAHSTPDADGDGDANASFFSPVSLRELPHLSRYLQNLQPRPNPLDQNPFFHPTDGFYVTATSKTSSLCPGMNTVIRELVIGLWELYGVRQIYGIKAGYRGFYSSSTLPLLELNPKIVHNWHMRGGTVLETSRGGFDLQKEAAFKESAKRSNWKRGGKTEIGGLAVSGKRKTWKSEEVGKIPTEIAEGKIDSTPPPKSPILSKESVSVDGIEKIPIWAGRMRSESEISKSVDFSAESAEIKAKSDGIGVVDQNSALDGEEKGNDGSNEANQKIGSDENCREFGVCEEKAIPSSVNDVEVEDEEFFKKMMNSKRKKRKLRKRRSKSRK